MLPILTITSQPTRLRTGSKHRLLVSSIRIIEVISRLSEKTTRLEAMKRAPWSIKPFNIHSKLIAPISAREVAKESEKLDLKLVGSMRGAFRLVQACRLRFLT